MHKLVIEKTLHIIFFEILKFVFLSEFAYRSFCVKFSCLIGNLESSKNHKFFITKFRIFNVQIYVWSLFKS